MASLSGVGRSARDRVYAASDWVRDRDPEAVVIGGACAIVLIVSAIGLFQLARDGSAETPIDHPGRSQRAMNTVAFTNHAAGYGFAYPAAWNVKEQGTTTLLGSPNGRIDVSFGISSSGDMERVAYRLARSSGIATIESIGTGRRRIGGARAFLSAGLTLDETGRSIRFLAIAIDGGRGTYTILIAVPAAIDPARVLPSVEHVVSSFRRSEGVAA